LMITIS